MLYCNVGGSSIHDLALPVIRTNHSLAQIVYLAVEITLSDVSGFVLGHAFAHMLEQLLSMLVRHMMRDALAEFFEVVLFSMPPHLGGRHTFHAV